MKRLSVLPPPLPLRTLLLALALIAIFLAQILSVVRREVMTNDEGITPMRDSDTGSVPILA